MSWVIRDFLELLIVVAIGGMVVSAVVRMRRGQIVAHKCALCGSAISRMYANCPKCGTPQPSA